MEQIPKRRMPGTGDEISILGFGCMRLKRNLAATDMVRTEQQVRLAIEAGVNYFDTAYIYPGSEKAIGTILAGSDGRGGKLSDNVYIATKLPLVLVRKREDMDRYLGGSLERLGVDFIDYYLIHSVNSFDAWERCKKNGALDFLEKAKAGGRIGRVGFSWHGNLQNFKKMIDDYPWDFCQIQFNYLDEYFQAGAAGLEYAAARGIGVVVMEPLRGGTLAGRLPKDAKPVMEGYADSAGRKHPPAYWGLRWVWNHPEVVCALSGMNDVRQVEENVSAAMDAALPGSLSDGDLAMIGGVRDVFRRAIRVDCTGCAYCMPCPHGVDIPYCFSALNSQAMFGKVSGRFMYNFNMMATSGKPSAKASACKKCGVCETKCPQHLPIVKSLEETAKVMESPFYSATTGLAGKIMQR